MSRPQAKKLSAHSKVVVRFAAVDDAAEISRVLLEAFGSIREHYTLEAFNAVTPTAEEIETRFAEGPMWVAELDGKVVGTVSLSTEAEGLYVRSMAVVPEAQGQGVARELLKSLHDHAAGTGAKRIFLYTLPFQKGAREMYEKFGYTWVRDTTAEEWFGVPGLEMELFIGKENAA
jgi:N-acetylglutamate synthase-like GNAT family acetyltransferase